MTKFEFPADLKAVNQASQAVLNEVNSLNLDDKVLFEIKLCVEEAFINAVKYGNQFNKSLPVHIEVECGKDAIDIFLSDYGEGFDPNKVDDPTTKENLTKLSGRGVFLVKNLMDKVRYNKRKKCLHMTKKITKTSGGRR